MGLVCATLLHAAKYVLIQGKTQWLDFSLLCVMGCSFGSPLLYCRAAGELRTKLGFGEQAPPEIDFYWCCVHPGELGWEMGSGQSCSSACTGGEVTASALVQGRLMCAEMCCEGGGQGSWWESPGQHLLLLKVVSFTSGRLSHLGWDISGSWCKKQCSFAG